MSIFSIKVLEIEFEILVLNFNLYLSNLDLVTNFENRQWFILMFSIFLFKEKNLNLQLAVDFPELPDPQSMFCLRFFRHDPRPFFRFAKVSGKNEFSVF